MSLQKKQLVGVHNIDNFIEGGELIASGNEIILTPGAKDILRTRGISICYKEPLAKDTHTEATKDSAKQQQEEIVALIIRLLRNEYNVADPAKLQDIAVRVLEKMMDAGKNNLI